MRVSREDADGLFIKWQTEAARLGVILLTVGFGLESKDLVVSFLGSDSSIVLSTRVNPDTHNIVIALQHATFFQYFDAREAPAEIRQRLSEDVESVLAIGVEGTGVLFVYASP